MIDPADNVTHSLPVTAPLTLRVNTSTKAIQAELKQDLLGDWILVQSWTAKGKRRSGRKSMIVASQEEGLAILERLVKSAA